MQAWCKDFAGDPKHKRPAACCSKDDDIALGWCRDGKHRGDPRWPQVCDPRDANFGAQNWVIDGGGALRVANALLANETKDESGFCEVLGQVRCPHVHLAGGVKGTMSSLAKLAWLFGLRYA